MSKKIENDMKKELLTGTEAGFSGEDQVAIAVKAIRAAGGNAEMKQLYVAMEKEMEGKKLSAQGKASFRFFVNKVAVEAGLVYPHDKNNSGWFLTPAGREYAQKTSFNEITVNTDTNEEEVDMSNTARGLAFELYAQKLLKAWYPNFVWHHQGILKAEERGLDFIGDRLGDSNSDIRTIGVQVKFHKKKNSPAQMEWLKFLSGCFARRVDAAIFITTGRLSGAQYREARESNVIVIQGRDEIGRLAEINNIVRFELFENET